MPNKTENPRILIVTPEVSHLPREMDSASRCRNAKAGGLGDVSAALINTLYEQGVDVHLAIPDYRNIFSSPIPMYKQNKLRLLHQSLPHDKIHLAQDRAFFYLNRVYSGSQEENINISLAFQREVINHIVPQVQPDLIHCNDWMTGLIPAIAREIGIPCLFSIHNIHTVHVPLSHIEDRGIDGASFWHNLYFDRYPGSYEDTRNNNPVDFLASGVFAAHFVNTVSPTFLDEVINGYHGFVSESLKHELADKKAASCAVGILNAPDTSFDPSNDKALPFNYSSANHSQGKAANKFCIQKSAGLKVNPNAPLFFWPSRLDPVQKGCQLLSDILYHVVSRYWNEDLEFIFVADGPFQKHFKDIVRFHGLQKRVAFCDFDEQLSRMAYGAADFVLMPSGFEPCGLPQMIGSIYGALPVVRDTGGLHDTVSHLDMEKNKGNGFVFETFDANGLSWAIDQAMAFFLSPQTVKNKQIKRIMEQSRCRFSYKNTARQYIRLYEQMLERPLVAQDNVTVPETDRTVYADASSQYKSFQSLAMHA
ncbi:MAG: glycogen synthase [Desulfobacterium sp.]|nr:glycogen synthase [Desulfobacteraceae bacterium]MBA3036892.1 glycogen synthase [Desulfobacterium sp.]